ncbi:MAG: patatin-like phospholipase family protein [Thaumarchaeota archaeon]|nr:patatin-like phospholipase family protein [Nitrososphaerota archaeon]
MQSLSSREKQNLQFETILVLQGGGSLGAYECGVYKALHRHGIKFDIVAGTSIGAVNASIITGSKSDEPAKALEEFWLDLAEGVTSPGLPDNIRPYFASMYSAFFGNPKMFFPKWFIPSADYFMPYFWQYMYDITPLKKTLDQYIDFQKIQSPKRPRLIITSTDIQNAKPSVFDSKYDHIEADHVLASAGYPFYGISWTQKSGKYLWDGTLLSNTPLREVINASPKLDKNVYVVDLFPKNQPELPNNMFEVWHRARDIIHTDKTEHNIHMSKTITRYLKLIREMHEILSSSTLDEKGKSKLALLEQEYHKLASERGSIINQIVRIQRHEHVHFLLEDADFSIATIKELIEKGEKDTKEALVTNNVE